MFEAMFAYWPGLTFMDASLLRSGFGVGFLRVP